MANNLNAIGVFVFVAILMVNFSKNMAVILTVSLLCANFFVASYGSREGMENKEEEKVAEEEGAKDKKKKDTRESTRITDDAIVPPPMDTEVDTDTFDLLKGSKLDGEKTALNAYKDLDSILDPQAIDKLTKETMELMQQQQNLFSSMQSMTPLLTQANTLLKGFDMSKLQGLASTASELSAPEKK